MTGRNPGQLAHGQRRDEESGQTDHDGGCDRKILVPAAERVAHRREADREVAPVLDRVEGAVERDEEAEVEGLDQDQHAEQRADHPRHEASSTRRQHEGQADDDESLEREPREGTRGELPRPDREHEREPHDRQGKHREHGGHDRASGPGCGWAGGRLLPVPPQPPDVAAERLGEHGERDDQQYAAHPQRRYAGSSDHERDPLRGRHRLAPVAPRQRRPQPRERPARREERVAREADQEHPAAGRRGDLDAEHEDQERVDLSVQLRPEGRLRPRASREPAVGEIERQRDGRERHKCRGRHRELEGSRGQRGDADRERRAGQRDPAGPAETR